MKTKIFKRPGRALGEVSPRLVPTRRETIALLALLLGAANLTALPVVSTISGGPSYGYADGDTLQVALFHTPLGLALDSSGSLLFVADRDNNAIRKLDLGLNQTITFTTDGINQPVGVALDGTGNLYVLNRGNGNNGSVLKFDAFSDPLGAIATNLSNANGIALDGSANVYVTASGNTVVRISPAGVITTLATIAGANVLLQGITVQADGSLAVCDSGRNSILTINPATGTYATLTGTNVAGDHFGPAGFARFNQPYGIAAAGGGMLAVTDNANHRVKVVDSSGTVCSLYGVCSADWVVAPSDPMVFPGWHDGSGCPCEITCQICDNYAESRLPGGVVVAPDGSIYTTEDYYHIIRHTTGTGLLGPGSTGVGSTNVPATPAISPNSGYYPMGQLITVSSPNPLVYYTTDGSEPTTNSIPVIMNANVGTIHWFNSTNDLTGLRVKAFVGTNGSATVSGQPVSASNIGTPSGPTVSGNIFGGIGSTIVVPVVVNLRTNDQIQSYQFRVEVTPNGAARPIASGFDALNISTNDFVLLATAARPGATGSISVVSYNIGSTAGLQVSAIGNSANISFQRFAVVALLKVPIPTNANVGDTYSVAVINPSATSDGFNAAVSLTPMAAATILVTNVAYTVGDSASLFGGWYNAGSFGDGNLDNSDVNNAFYAAIGLRVPYAFSDVFDTMDVYPLDEPGFVGGDGQIRFLDWQHILLRSLRLETTNWARAWSAGGNLTNFMTSLQTMRRGYPPKPPTLSPWYRQVLLGAISVGNALPGSTVNMPVYVKLADGSTLSGLQFRAVIAPQGSAPALAQALQFIPAAGVPTPSFQQSFQPGATGYGWPLGSFNFLSRSSNFLGWVSFTLPVGALSGQAYTLSFTNADGAPDLNTQYDFETRSAHTAVNAAAAPASICSDEWKLYFFGSLTDPRSADLADPDGDGVPNWMEFLAGTIPTNSTSKLRFTGAGKQLVNGQSQMVVRWLTAQGRAYEVQWANQAGGAWNALGTVSGDGTATNYTDANVTAAARYYRLRLLP